MQFDDVQLYLVFFCGLLLLLKQKLCPRMETPATYSIKSLTHPSSQHHQPNEEEEKKKQQDLYNYIGLAKIINNFGLFQQFLTSEVSEP